MLRQNANDVEACGCLTGPAKNMITGVVFYDIDSSGTYNKAIDSIESTIVVYLYRDVNSDGNIDGGDYVVDSAYSNGANGIYLFLIDSLGDFLTRPQIAGTPLQNYNVTTNDSLKEEAHFVNFGEVDGKNDFGFHITAGSSPVLPVSWLNVDAEWIDENAQVSWSTASEQENNYFEVQRSYDGKTFNTIGTVKASANEKEINSYSFTDLNAYHRAPEFSYYRIVQVDYNEEVSYSKIVSLEKQVSIKVLTWPNPFENEISISFENGYKNVDIQLVDVMGSIVVIQNYTDNEQKTITLNNLDHLSHGVYYLNINKDGQTKVVKLIK